MTTDDDRLREVLARVIFETASGTISPQTAGAIADAIITSPAVAEAVAARRVAEAKTRTEIADLLLQGAINLAKRTKR